MASHVTGWLAMGGPGCGYTSSLVYHGDLPDAAGFEPGAVIQVVQENSVVYYCCVCVPIVTKHELVA